MTRPIFPGSVAIETINTCNARCPFCPLFQGDAQMDRHHRPAKVMDDDLYEACLAEISAWDQRPSSIYLNMNGEPLSDPKFEARLSLAKRFGLCGIIDLQTNAQYLSESMTSAILQAGVRRITIGFDGYSKEVYAAHRVRCDYDKVLKNVRSFVAMRDAGNYKTRVAIQYVRTKRNDHEVLDAYNMFNEFMNDELDIFQDNLSKDWGDREGSSDLYYIGKHQQTTPAGCPLFSDQLIVLSDGVLAACCWDYNLAVSSGGFGNVKELGLLNAWRGSKRAKVLEALESGSVEAVPEKCRSCMFLYPEEKIDPAQAKLQGPLASVAFAGFTYRFSRPNDGFAIRRA